MQNLKFDHIIHYIKHIDEFQYPGEILKVVPGGLHNRYGTHNKLAYTDLAYIELIGVNDEEKLKKVIKTNEGRVSFIAKIVQDNFKQGFKTFEEERKATLESKFQPQFKIKAIEVQTTDTEQVVNQWRDWFDMEVIESDNDVTILKLPQEAIEFRIRKARKNGYDIVIQDKETEAPYNITTRGAEYHFLP